MSVEKRVLNIVKEELGIGLMTEDSDFFHDHGADATDVIHIIDAVERHFEVDFDDKEHFQVKNVNDIVKILNTKTYAL